MYRLEDTIVAIASPLGAAARGVVRLSGPEVLSCLRGAFLGSDSLPQAVIPRPMVLAGSFRIPAWYSPVPCQLYLWPEGRSYTAQPVAELHTVGSLPLLEAVVRTLCAAGARPAEPGEFTLRAFLAGRIDLTQAEAVLGVVDAADRCQLEVALRQLAGGLAGPLRQLRQMLLDLLVQLEASLDFAEEDIEVISPAQVAQELAAAAGQIRSILRQMRSRGQTGGAIRAVLTGRPNAGKSSLFNALVGSSAAIVSAQPGTTRDYLTAELALDGLPCQLVDTAGWDTTAECADAGHAEQLLDKPSRPWPEPPHGNTGNTAEPSTTESHPDIQQAAQQQTAEQLRRADVRILCIDAARPLDEHDAQQLALAQQGNCIVALTKIDIAQSLPAIPHAVATSSVTGQGLEALRKALREAALRAVQTEADVVSSTALRCRHVLEAAEACLCRASELAGRAGTEELIAAELREAIDQLGTVIGAVYTEDLLDRIFSRFCIGK